MDTHLNIDELRARFHRHTRSAFLSLTLPDRPRILEAGCGEGTVTLELARLSAGPIVGIDVDGPAVEALQVTLEKRGLGDRVTAQTLSLLEAPKRLAPFDLLWAEGVLHLLDLPAALAACKDLLVDRAPLVICEAQTWFQQNLPVFESTGFSLQKRIDWPPGAWQEEYFAPMAESIAKVKREGCEDLSALKPYEEQVAWARAHPEDLECLHAVFRKFSTEERA